MVKRKCIGFGFIPEEAQQHFLVISYPVSKNKPVIVYERFTWDDSDVQTSETVVTGNYRLKIRLNNEKWQMVKPALEAEFNRILKQDNKTVGRFKVGQIPIDRLLGKEMMVLLWAIEDCDPALIPVAIKNWLGFTREERWWLFTMTNALTGDAENKRGWRIALRYAITDNFKSEKKTEQELFSSLAQ